jgi:negative regulator of flagellin synthesis FlgM
MKINESIKPVVSPAQPRQAKDVEKASSEKAAPVKISQDTAAVVEKLSTAPAAGGPGASAVTFDTKKVEALKAAIAAGTFKVNTGKIADGLLASVKDLLHPKK